MFSLNFSAVRERIGRDNMKEVLVRNDAINAVIEDHQHQRSAIVTATIDHNLDASIVAALILPIRSVLNLNSSVLTKRFCLWYNLNGKIIQIYYIIIFFGLFFYYYCSISQHKILLILIHYISLFYVCIETFIAIPESN